MILFIFNPKLYVILSLFVMMFSYVLSFSACACFVSVLFLCLCLFPSLSSIVQSTIIYYLSFFPVSPTGVLPGCCQDVAEEATSLSMYLETADSL